MRTDRYDNHHHHHADECSHGWGERDNKENYTKEGIHEILEDSLNHIMTSTEWYCVAKGYGLLVWRKDGQWNLL